MKLLTMKNKKNTNIKKSELFINFRSRKAQGLSIDIMVLIALALVIIVVMVYLLSSRTKIWVDSTEDCKAKGGEFMSSADCKAKGGVSSFLPNPSNQNEYCRLFG